MRSWRIFFIFLGVFFAGAIAGGFISLRLASNVAERRMPDDLSLKIMRRFSQRLELTEAQRERIEPYVERAAAQMGRLRQQTAQIVEELHQSVSRELTPAQRDILQTMLEEQRERWKRWAKKREEESMGGGHGHGAGRDGAEGAAADGAAPATAPAPGAQPSDREP